MFKKIILSIFAGFLFFVSWPPMTNFTFLIFIAFVPLFIIELYFYKKEIGLKEYLGYIYLAFFIFNLSVTFWIKHAHLGGAIFAILCNSFFMTFVFFLYSRIKCLIDQKQSFLIFTILWIGFEYLHLNWDLSWPWLTLGNIFSAHPNWVQWYSYSGVLGGTCWILIMNFLFLKLYQYKNSYELRNFYLVITMLFFLLPIGVSYLIYNNNLQLVSNDTVNVLVVQPNIDPYEDKFALSQQQQNKVVLDLIETKINNRLDFLILPETFLVSPIWTHDMQRNPDLKLFKKLTKQYNNLNIIIGATLLDLSKKSATSKPLLNYKNQFYKVHNSVIHLSNFSIDKYYKSKLVPGAEQMPFQNFLYPILGDKILQIGDASSLGNFSTQDSVSIFSNSKGNNAAPIICYESIYGDYVRKFVQKGAEVIFIITNDGWWKKTSGYQQHNMYAKLRAIETRRYVARSANTGISSIINHFGELESSIEWDKKDIIEYTIPLYNQDTFYVQYGDVLGRLSSFLSIILILYFFVYNKLQISH